MKAFLLTALIFSVAFIFYEYEPYKIYVKNSQIEKYPVYTTAHFYGIGKAKSRYESDFLKYKFQTSKGEFFGNTDALDNKLMYEYISSGSISIVYYANE